eukprot:4780662-Pleurochrysis_carterae.AAC.2
MDALRLGGASPPPKRLVQVEHRNVREVGHPRHRLQEPEARERPAVEAVVERVAEYVVRYRKYQRRLDRRARLLAVPHGLVAQREVAQRLAKRHHLRILHRIGLRHHQRLGRISLHESPNRRGELVQLPFEVAEAEVEKTARHAARDRCVGTHVVPTRLGEVAKGRAVRSSGGFDSDACRNQRLYRCRLVNGLLL